MVVTGVVLFVEAGRETEIRQLDVSVLVNEDVVRLNVTANRASSVYLTTCYPRLPDEPMDEAKFVDGFDSEDTLRDVETGNVLRERVVLDQHRHEIASGQELHDEVQVLWVLEGVVKLDHPWRIRLGQDIALCAYVGELWRALVDRRIGHLHAQTCLVLL